MSSITDRIKKKYLWLRERRDYLVKHQATVELKKELNRRFEISFSMLMNVFVFLAIVKIFVLIYSSNPDFYYIIDIGEKATLFVVAVTGLAFTYAAALDYPKKERIIESGEYFLRSFLTFVIGMVFSIGIKQALMSPSNSSYFPGPLAVVAVFGLFLFFIISLVLLIVSGYFFVKGTRLLLRSV